MIAIKCLNDCSNPNRELSALDHQIEKSLREAEGMKFEQPKIQTPVTAKYYRQMLIKELLNKIKVIGIFSIHISSLFLLKNISQMISPNL